MRISYKDLLIAEHKRKNETVQVHLLENSEIFLVGIVLTLFLILFCLYKLYNWLYTCFETRRRRRVAPIEWNVIKELGSGAFSRVNLVRNNFGYLQARKEIYLKIITDKEKLANAKNEVEVLKKLKHTHVVRVFDAELSLDLKYFYIYMEYAEHGTLRDLLGVGGPISELDTKRYSRQLLYALKYMHEEADVVHRDIKPENILVFSDNVLKLTDFNVSKTFKEISILTTVMGSPYYFPKEVLEGKYGRKCDIWSLGIVIFEMVTGKLPWKNKNMHAIMFDICIKGIKPDVDSMQVSIEMKEFLKTMYFEESLRPSASELLNHPWAKS